MVETNAMTAREQSTNRERQEQMYYNCQDRIGGEPQIFGFITGDEQQLYRGQGLLQD